MESPEAKNFVDRISELENDEDIGYIVIAIGFDESPVLETNLEKEDFDNLLLSFLAFYIREGMSFGDKRSWH